MKKLIATALVSLPLAFSARAQWIVYDPTSNIQEIINQAQNIAKYIEMINNQVQQIQTLTEQLDEFKNYEAVFGKPGSVSLPTLSALNSDLQKTETGQNLEALLSAADGSFALTYNGSGIFQTVGETFTTPGGQTIARPADVYKPFAAISRTADNYTTVAADAASRRVALKRQIARTSAQLKAAGTDAEVQKLQAVLSGLSADLASTDAEVNQALASAQVQDIQNRNDEKKQQQARKERQQAEFHETLANYGAKFQLLSAPVHFPTGN